MMGRVEVLEGWCEGWEDWVSVFRVKFLGLGCWRWRWWLLGCAARINKPLATRCFAHPVFLCNRGRFQMGYQWVGQEEYGGGYNSPGKRKSYYTACSCLHKKTERFLRWRFVCVCVCVCVCVKNEDLHRLKKKITITVVTEVSSFLECYAMLNCQ